MRCKTSGSSPALDQKRRIVVAQIVALQADCCQEQPFCRCAGVPLMNGLRDALIDSPVKSVRACRSGPAVQPKENAASFPAVSREAGHALCGLPHHPGRGVERTWITRIEDSGKPAYGAAFHK